ncbi:hypothetical protein GCM10022259_33820 [Aquimarina mytili]
MFIGVTSEAQLFDKVIKKVKTSIGKTRVMSLNQTAPISTSIQDTLSGIDWFDEDLFRPELSQEIGSAKLGPGYYRSKVRSYCLKAGVYGPTKGDGYQIAKLKGSRAKVIHNILKKSVKYPEISQSNVQTLIWGIEAGTKFSKYPLNFQKKIRPLLTKKEMLSMEVDFDKIKDKLLPKEIRYLAKTYASLRNKMQTTQMKYDEIEAIAVKTGIPPLGAGSKEIHKGLWSYIGNGFFLRATPEVYSTTLVELYRPAVFDIVKDDKGRIMKISNHEMVLKIDYDENFGAGVFEYSHTQIPVWKMKKLHIQDLKSKQDTVLTTNQWMFRGSWEKIEIALQNKSPKLINNKYSPTTNSKGGPFPYTLEPSVIYNDKKEPTFEEVYERGKKFKEWIENIKKYKDFLKEVDDLSTIHGPDYYSSPEFYEKMSAEGIKAAVSFDRSEQGKWMRKLGKMNRDLLTFIFFGLGGKYGPQNNDPIDPDLASYPGQPGNTSKQRIGLSQYKK